MGGEGIKMISKAGLEEFKQIYKEEFGVFLTNEEALEKALPVLNLIKTLMKPKKDLSTQDPVDAEVEEVAI